jgi:hypothetical protein
MIGNAQNGNIIPETAWSMFFPAGSFVVRVKWRNRLYYPKRNN